MNQLSLTNEEFSSDIVALSLAQNQSLKFKFHQLSLEFEEVEAISPYTISDFYPLKKMYAPFDMGKYPFFLTARTKKGKDSRVGYMANRLKKSMESKGFTNEEVDKACRYSATPSSFSLKTKMGWEITAHQNYGFPDSLDGYVFEYILYVISSIYNKKSQFYLIYFISLKNLVKYLKNQGYYSGAGGEFYERIRDCFYRLKHTSYTLSKGHFLRCSNSHYSSYSFNLISSVFEKGSILPNGSICNSFGIAIDPLLLRNFSSNYFLILLNSYRSLLKNYNSKMLFDRVSYLTFNSLKSLDFSLAFRYNFPLYLVVGYNNLCEYFGYTPVSGTNISKTKILERFSPQVKDLKDLGCLEEVYVDSYKKDSIRIIFIIQKSFADDVLKLFNKGKVSDFYDYKHSPEEINRYFAKTFKLINCPKLRKLLFPSKHFDNSELVPSETSGFTNEENAVDLDFIEN